MQRRNGGQAGPSKSATQQSSQQSLERELERSLPRLAEVLNAYGVLKKATQATFTHPFAPVRVPMQCMSLEFYGSSVAAAFGQEFHELNLMTSGIPQLGSLAKVGIVREQGLSVDTKVPVDLRMVAQVVQQDNFQQRIRQFVFNAVRLAVEKAKTLRKALAEEDNMEIALPLSTRATNLHAELIEHAKEIKLGMVNVGETLQNLVALEGEVQRLTEINAHAPELNAISPSMNEMAFSDILEHFGELKQQYMQAGNQATRNRIKAFAKIVKGKADRYRANSREITAEITAFIENGNKDPAESAEEVRKAEYDASALGRLGNSISNALGRGGSGSGGGAGGGARPNTAPGGRR